MGEHIDYQLSLFDYEQASKGIKRYVRRISYEDTKPFLLGIHYARRMPCITDAFGLFVDEQMIGVVTYGVPASMPLCIGLAGEKNRYRVLELNRLALLPKKQSMNDASYLVSHSLKLLRDIYIYIYIYVASYADTAWGHVGYVYQATNWLYTGMSAKRNDTYQPNGLHPRAYDKNNHSDLKQTRSPKHRYVYLVGDRRKRKEMLKELRYPIMKEYPKGDSRHYDTNNPVPVKRVEIISNGQSIPET